MEWVEWVEWVEWGWCDGWLVGWCGWQRCSCVVVVECRVSCASDVRAGYRTTDDAHSAVPRSFVCSKFSTQRKGLSQLAYLCCGCLLR